MSAHGESVGMTKKIIRKIHVENVKKRRPSFEDRRDLTNQIYLFVMTAA